MIREPDLFIFAGLTDKSAAEYLNKLFGDAARECATDIHFLFQEQSIKILFRISGKLQRIDTVSGTDVKYIDEKIRSRSNIPVSDRHSPQDGRMRLRFPDRAIDVRVSIVPIVGGQKVVCRLLDQSNSARNLSTIDMSMAVRHGIEDVIEEPHGLFIVCGPTGSGKTTTLYGILNELNDESRNIVTIENPVEYVVPGVAQINIDLHVTFGGALRAVLRQDPDVILIGEIRDAETAQIAAQAANTGHLVLATMHANNSALAITRLLDFGVDPQTLSAALRCVLAQRLVQRIAPEAERAWTPPSESDVIWMNGHGIAASDSKFCHVQNHTDYAGMTPLIEMIRVDGAVRAAIQSGRGEAEIFNAAARQIQFETLAQAGVRMAASGVTSIDHVKKIVGNDAIVTHVKRLGQVLVESGAISSEQANRAVEIQTELRRKGVMRHLGEILLEEQMCSAQEIVDAIGVTDTAIKSAEHLVSAGKITKEQLVDAADEWGRKQKKVSLFRVIEDKGYIKKGDYDESSIVYCTNRCGSCRANCPRAGSRTPTGEPVSGSSAEG